MCVCVVSSAGARVRGQRTGIESGGRLADPANGDAEQQPCRLRDADGVLAPGGNRTASRRQLSRPAAAVARRRAQSPAARLRQGRRGGPRRREFLRER